MILAAYAILVAAVAWGYTRKSPWLRTLGPRGRAAVRVATLATAALLGGAAVALAVDAAREPDHSLEDDIETWLLLGVIAAGGALYALGSALWRGVSAARLRVAGFVLLAAGLIVPSTATLALPLVAALVVGLARVD